MDRIEEFFERYERGANTFDPDVVAPQYTDPFMGGDPNGVACIPNDEAFRASISQRQAFFRHIGFRSARILDLTQTPLDERYTQVKVHWQMVFEKTPGSPQEFRFHITYFLFDPGSGPKIAFYISHDDERKTMRDAGLIP
ncbi:hypothetical protein [Lysobacter sp.]|uniref:hypothetical protein n=1 Tax=Lysobacter sp. TaxID=72226 RepID=UPI002D275A1D|nr:hypothetical protein [Lysobacter sp.]HZX76730.1 hypothetical protein [Lysobacter sp.]